MNALGQAREVFTPGQYLPNAKEGRLPHGSRPRARQKGEHTDCMTIFTGLCDAALGTAWLNTGPGSPF